MEEFLLWHKGNLTAGAQVTSREASSIPSPAQWIEGSGIAAATAQIQTLGQERPYAVGVAIKKRGGGDKELWSIYLKKQQKKLKVIYSAE